MTELAPHAPASSESTALTHEYVRVLSIAGSDSGGGAGIQADLKTIAALGCYGMTAITAITAQNTVGVHAIHALPPELLAAQIDAVQGDIGAHAVKIGMLHDPVVVRVVAQAVRRHGWRHVVLDPVMVATSGDRLIAEETIAVLVNELFPLVSVITPNLDEASLLLGRPLTLADQLQGAADDLLALGAPSVLLKGGHLPGNEVIDLLVQPGQAPQRFSSPRIASRNGHGAGCTFSAALACELALGLELTDAVRNARSYILNAIVTGAEVRTGHGHGPLNHGHDPIMTRRVRPVAAPKGR